jgi:hypothetical protein
MKVLSLQGADIITSSLNGQVVRMNQRDTRRTLNMQAEIYLRNVG